jgi:hypothetical protein
LIPELTLNQIKPVVTTKHTLNMKKEKLLSLWRERERMKLACLATDNNAHTLSINISISYITWYPHFLLSFSSFLLLLCTQWVLNSSSSLVSTQTHTMSAYTDQDPRLHGIKTQIRVVPNFPKSGLFSTLTINNLLLLLSLFFILLRNHHLCPWVY